MENRYKVGQTVYGSLGNVLFEVKIAKIVKVETITAGENKEMVLYGSKIEGDFDSLHPEETLASTPEGAVEYWQKQFDGRAEKMLLKFKEEKAAKSN